MTKAKKIKNLIKIKTGIQAGGLRSCF